MKKNGILLHTEYLNNTTTVWWESQTISQEGVSVFNIAQYKMLFWRIWIEQAWWSKKTSVTMNLVKYNTTHTALELPQPF